MPLLTRWFIKAALLYLVLALLTGLLQSIQPVRERLPWIAALGPVYFHLFMVGWVTQLIFGVVFWMFPKYSREQPRGSEPIGWAVFWLINLGLLLRAVAEPANSLQPNTGWGWLLASSALLQWLAGIGFAANTWGRVKEK